MEHIPQDDVLQLGMKMFKTIGESMTVKSSLLLNLYRFINIVILSFIFTAIVVNLFHVEGAMYIQNVEGLISVFHVSIRI